MKNLKESIVVLLLLIVYFSSCTVNEIHEDTVSTFTQNYTIYQDDWSIGRDDESGPYFYYEFKEPNLTLQVYERGVMQAFLVLKNNNLSPLPFNDYWIENNIYWTEQVTCEFRPGVITFILKYSDHENIRPYYIYDFRVRFMW